MPQKKKEKNEGEGTGNEEAKPAQKSQGVKKAGPKGILGSQMPVYQALLLALAVFLIGVLIAYKTLPAILPPANCAAPAADTKVDVILLYSHECGFCEKSNSIIDVFSDRGIPYKKKEVEASTPEGKELVAKYGVDEVPAALVSYEQMHIYSTTEKGISQRFKRVLDRYVVTEENLNLDYFYSSMFLDTSDCNSPSKDKVSVMYFDDPNHAVSLQKRPYVRDAITKFGDRISFGYVYFPTKANLFSDKNYRNIELAYAANYFKCAQLQGKYLEFETIARAMFCGVGSDNNLTDQELMLCISGSTYLKPLGVEKLETAASASQLVTYNLATCLENDLKQYKEWETIIYKYGVDKRERPIGVAIVGCRFFVDAKNIDRAICASSPYMEGC